LKSPLRLLLANTIVAVIPVHLATAQVFEDVPVPGGRVALAARMGVDPVPDRARFISEIARLMYGRGDRKPLPPAVLATQLGIGVASDPGTNELVPVPLTAAVWGEAVFRRRVSSGQLVQTILADRQAALLCHGLAALDDETLQYLADHPAILRQIHAASSEAFAVFANSLRVRGNRVVTPGGEDAVVLWEAVVGASVGEPARFIAALFTLGDGRLAGLYDTISQLDPARQRFALGLWLSDPAARLNAMRALAVAVSASSGEWRALKSQPFVRQSYDFTTALTRVRVDADGRPTAPSTRGFWSRAMAVADLPVDPAAELESIDNTPIDAAWLAELTTTSDIRLRAERLDQVAFGQRVFAEATRDEMPDVLVATRAFRRYRMMMVTLERIGIRTPALYAAEARFATRLSPEDPGRAFVASAQYQGVIALLARMRMADTLNSRQIESLLSSLLLVPLNADSQYLGGVLRWITNELEPMLPPAETLEARLQAAASGPDTTASAPRVEWEGQTYRFDLAAAERRRLQRIREKQGGATIDMAMLFATAADRLASQPALEAVREVTDQLRPAAKELDAEFRRGAFHAREDFPPGVVPPPMPLDTLTRAIGELERIGADGTVARAAAERAAAELATAADQAAAQALVSLVYAMNLGDPDGPALLPGNISLRHDFGLGQRDTAQRLRATWMAPVQDVSPGVPWHIDGALLGLDAAMATVALRRLNTDRTLQAPTLTSNERETFAVGFALMNPFALTDAARDAIAGAIERGRRQVSMLRSATDIASTADELEMDGWRRRALRWTVENEPSRVETLFSLRELMALGRTPPGLDLDAWGTSALPSMGCFCLQMPPPGRLPLVTGRRQIGLLAAAVPDLNLQVALTLFRLRLPARLAKYVLSAAVLDFMEGVRGTDTDDWLSLVRGAAAVTQERIEDYVAAAAADGPLVPDSAR